MTTTEHDDEVHVADIYGTTLTIGDVRLTMAIPEDPAPPAGSF